MRYLALVFLALMLGCAHKPVKPNIVIPALCPDGHPGIQEMRIQPETMCDGRPDGWFDCKLVSVKPRCIEAVKP